ncbi:MAG: TIGR00730 family Rossman fold protein [Bacteroidota bacterium]
MAPIRTEHDIVQDNRLDQLLKAQDDIWRVFRVMSEFVEGFQTFSRLGPCITIFGSARTKPGTRYYEMTVDVAREFVRSGYGIISGGGPGIMEAANKGAKEAGGVSVGINIDLPFEQSANAYIDKDKLITFRHFYVRKVMFVKYAQAFIVMPGGFGTLDEMFESITLVQTKKVNKFPIILMGKEYWAGMFDWIKSKMLAEGNISKEDLQLFSLTDDPKNAAQIVTDFYKTTEHAPNF